MYSLSLCNWDEVRNVNIRLEEAALWSYLKITHGFNVKYEVIRLLLCSEEAFGKNICIKNIWWLTQLSNNKDVQRTALVPAPN